MKQRSGKVRREVIEQSGSLVKLADGWLTDSWVVARFTDSSGTYAPMVVRAELSGGPDRWMASVTSLNLGDGSAPVLARQVRALATILPNLAAEALVLVTTPETGHQKPGADDLVRAMKGAMRRSAQTLQQREDEALRLWETKYQPQGLNQREAAEKFGITHGAFRSYLSHARSRRGN